MSATKELIRKGMKKPYFFEDYLMEVHAIQYIGLDDGMPDDFEDWLSSLGTDELVDYANEYGKKLLNLNKKPIKVDIRKRKVNKKCKHGVPETNYDRRLKVHISNNCALCSVTLKELKEYAKNIKLHIDACNDE